MPTTEETTDYFDRHAEDLRAERLVDKSDALRYLVFDRISAGSRVIEVGAGTGLYTFRLLADGHQVIAVDLSEACLDQIRFRAAGTEHAARLSTWRGDFLGFGTESEPGSFDAVVFIKILHHLPNRESMKAAIEHAYQLLRPGGRILIFEPNGSHPLWRPTLLARGRDYWRNERNVLLIRRRFLDDVLRRLPGARYNCSYRFVIPGGLVKRLPQLAPLDRRICERGGNWLDRLAVNIAFEVIKGPSSLARSPAS